MRIYFNFNFQKEFYLEDQIMKKDKQTYKIKMIEQQHLIDNLQKRIQWQEIIQEGKGQKGQFEQITKG